MFPFSNRAIQLIAEAKIQAAIEEGEFDILPGFGKPFSFDDQHYDPNWWVRNKVKRESLEKLFSPTPEIRRQLATS